MKIKKFVIYNTMIMLYLKNVKIKLGFFSLNLLCIIPID